MGGLRIGLGIGVGSGNRLPPYVDMQFLYEGFNVAETPYTFSQLISFTRTSSATYVNSAGNVVSAPAGTPRFDYDPVTLAPKGLLVEEQRTNLLLRSEEFDNGSWPKTGTTVTANATTSPDGTADADKIVENAGTSDHYIRQLPITVSSGATVTLSLYAKAAERGFIVLFEGYSGAGRYFNLTNGTLGNAFSGTPTSSSITPAGNGWYRCSITVTAPATATDFEIYLSATGTATNYAGDGTSGLFVYGAQLEAGSFATSYIPTVASQVTRTADVATITGANFSQWYNQSEGTFVVEASQIAATGALSRAITVSDGTNSETIQVAAGYSTEGYAEIRDGLALQMSAFNGVIAPHNVFRIALAVKANDCAISTNGAAPTVDTSVTMPTVNIANIGTGVAASSAINGHIRSIRYYPTRLSNAQLQALTA